MTDPITTAETKRRYDAMLRNLTATQAECTMLLEQNRELAATIGAAVKARVDAEAALSAERRANDVRRHGAEAKYSALLAETTRWEAACLKAREELAAESARVGEQATEIDRWRDTFIGVTAHTNGSLRLVLGSSHVEVPVCAGDTLWTIGAGLGMAMRQRWGESVAALATIGAETATSLGPLEWPGRFIETPPSPTDVRVGRADAAGTATDHGAKGEAAGGQHAPPMDGMWITGTWDPETEFMTAEARDRGIGFTVNGLRINGDIDHVWFASDEPKLDGKWYRKADVHAVTVPIDGTPNGVRIRVTANGASGVFCVGCGKTANETKLVHGPVGVAMCCDCIDALAYAAKAVRAGRDPLQPEPPDPCPLPAPGHWKWDDDVAKADGWTLQVWKYDGLWQFVAQERIPERIDDRATGDRRTKAGAMRAAEKAARRAWRVRNTVKP